MAKFAHADVLDGGPLVVKNSTTKMLLIKAYAFGDSLATVIGNKVSEVAMAATDLIITSSGNNRVLTVAAKSAAAAAIGGAGDHHIALVDATRVLLVTDETGEAAVAVSDTTTFPTWVYTAPQPT
jgi:hypothetical protein